MLTRPDGLKIVQTDLRFNFAPFEYLEIDLEHINKDDRSKYTADDVSFIVKELIDDLKITSGGMKQFGDEFCNYFVKNGTVDKKNFKLVFCVCSDRPSSIGVITLHRT
jgi:hypothetical protein